MKRDQTTKKHLHFKQGAVPKVVLLIESSREYARGLLRGIAAWNHKHGPWSFLFRPLGLTQLPTDWLARSDCDGILVRIDNKEMEKAVLRAGLPAIDLRGALANPEIHFIGVDNRKIADIGFHHLREAGFENYAFCGNPRHLNRFDDERCDYFQQFVKEADFPCFVFPADKVPKRGNRMENELHRIAEWLETLPIPTGLMACKDDRGIQVIDAARHIGRRVPDELAIISVDNDPYFCDMATPPMTSIATDSERIGYEAAAMLDRMMKGDKTVPKFTLIPPGEVIKRNSTDVLAIANHEDAQILQFLREKALAGLTVNEVINKFDISRSTLERLTKKYFKRTPKTEMLRIQIDHAKNLLKRTSLSVPIVALQSGFKSHRYFVFVFNQIVGMTPAHYRKQQ